jgi:hypothetical protein
VEARRDPSGHQARRSLREIKDWVERAAGKKPLFARCGEASAGHEESCNQEIRRLVQAVEDRDVLDRTWFRSIAGNP